MENEQITLLTIKLISRVAALHEGHVYEKLNKGRRRAKAISEFRMLSTKCGYINLRVNVFCENALTPTTDNREQKEMTIAYFHYQD